MLQTHPPAEKPPASEPPQAYNRTALDQANQQPALLDAALEYAALGLRVIPLHHLETNGHCSCRSPTCKLKQHGKHPRLNAWPQLATAEAATVQNWWQRWPRANLGIATGQGVLVLDVDGEEGEQTLKQLQKQHGLLPDTACVRTGSGGAHYYFRCSEVIGNPVKFLPGLDLRGDGGQVVAPPSTHYSGNAYTWIRHLSLGIAPCPDWLLAIIREYQRKEMAKSRPGDSDRPPTRLLASLRRLGSARSGQQATDDLHGRTARDGENLEQLLAELRQRYPITGPGMRNDRMVRAVGSLLGRGYAPEVTQAILGQWLEGYQDQMTTPLPEAQALLADCIDATLRSETFQIADQCRHLDQCRELELNPLQEAFLDSKISRPSNSSPDQLVVMCLSTGERIAWRWRAGASSSSIHNSGDLDKQGYSARQDGAPKVLLPLSSFPLCSINNNSRDLDECLYIASAQDQGLPPETLLPTWEAVPWQEVEKLDQEEPEQQGPRTLIPLCRGKQARAFVAAWLVHCLHKLLHSREQIIKATDAQIRTIMREQFDVTMDTKSYYRLKARYITREGKPATRFELLREVVKGCRQPDERVGTPSEYALTGLGVLFEQVLPKRPEEEPVEAADWPAPVSDTEDFEVEEPWAPGDERPEDDWLDDSGGEVWANAWCEDPGENPDQLISPDGYHASPPRAAACQQGRSPVSEEYARPAVKVAPQLPRTVASEKACEGPSLPSGASGSTPGGPAVLQAAASRRRAKERPP